MRRVMIGCVVVACLATVLVVPTASDADADTTTALNAVTYGKWVKKLSPEFMAFGRWVVEKLKLNVTEMQLEHVAQKTQASILPPAQPLWHALCGLVVPMACYMTYLVVFTLAARHASWHALVSRVMQSSEGAGGVRL